LLARYQYYQILIIHTCTIPSFSFSSMAEVSVAVVPRSIFLCLMHILPHSRKFIFASSAWLSSLLLEICNYVLYRFFGIKYMYSQERLALMRLCETVFLLRLLYAAFSVLFPIPLSRPSCRQARAALF